jgi:hypothetical protein
MYFSKIDFIYLNFILINVFKNDKKINIKELIG